MPRNGSGVYSLPAGSLVSDGDPGTASQHNTPLNDLVTDANDARPIVAGGTGATSAADARTNLGLVTQTAKDDSTASRVLLVGAFGLGETGSPTLIADIDETTTPAGMYRTSVATLGTFPSSALGGTLVVRRGTSTQLSQVWSATNSADVYVRFYNASWSTWRLSLRADHIGTTVQAFDTDLTAIAALTSAADKLPYATGAGTWALTDLSAAARTLLDDASVAAMRTTLGLAIGTDVQGWADPLRDIAEMGRNNGYYLRDNGNDLIATAINGTVSQSGGVATGSIAEVGSNANGVYYRFTNGLQVCTHALTSSATLATGWTFPAVFSTAPGFAAASPTVSTPRFGTVGNFNVNNCDFWAWTDAGAQAAVACRLLAVGQWF